MENNEILKKLRDAKDFVSGQELCEYYGVSRTAVWKAVKQLEKDGYKIEAQNNKGYRLMEDNTQDIFSRTAIESYIDTKWAGRKIIFHKETGSTNTDAKAAAENGSEEGTLVAADMQTAGKGRRGRGWEAPEGKNIYMTLVLRPQCMPDKASALTLVMALAVFEAVNDLCGSKKNIECGIKWPNDVVVNNKKICGILTEMSAEIESIHYVVIGVGINVNQAAFNDELKDKATSLFIESGNITDRSRLAAKVMHYFEKNYEIFCSGWTLSGLTGKYNSVLINRNKEVRVLDPKGEYNAIAYGINEKGELIVERMDNKERVNVYAGEVSVRGVYGYSV